MTFVVLNRGNGALRGNLDANVTVVMSGMDNQTMFSAKLCGCEKILGEFISLDCTVHCTFPVSVAI